MIVEENSVEVQISVRRKDTFRFLLHHGRRKRLIFSSVFYVLFFILILSASDIDTALFFAPVILTYLVFIWAIVLLIFFIRNLNHYRSISEYRNPMVLRFYVDHFRSKTNAGQARIAWENLNKITHDRFSFYFYTSRNIAIVIPKRYFTAEQTDQLKSFIKHIII